MVTSNLILALSALATFASASPIINVPYAKNSSSITNSGAKTSGSGKKFAGGNPSSVDFMGQVLSGVANDVSYAQKAVTNLQMEFIADSGDSSSESINQLIEGVDSETESLLNSMAYILNFKNSTYTSLVSKSVLTSYFQQVTNALNLAFDKMETAEMTPELSKTLNASAVVLGDIGSKAAELDLNTNLVMEIASAQSRAVLHTMNATSKNRRQANVLDNVVAGVTSAKQIIDNLTNNLIMKGPSPGLDTINNVVVNLDSQIDKVIGSVNANVDSSSIPSNVSGSGNYLGSFFQSVNKSSEVLLGYLSQGTLDPILAPNVRNMASSIGNLANLAGKYNMTETQTMLININHRIHLLFVGDRPAVVSFDPTANASTTATVWISPPTATVWVSPPTATVWASPTATVWATHNAWSTLTASVWAPYTATVWASPTATVWATHSASVLAM